MFITKKRHNHIIEHKNKTINDYCAKIIKLEKEIEQAKDVKELLGKLVIENSLFVTKDYMATICGSAMNIPDNVLVYVDDILGGKVIKQEGVKCLVVSKDGIVKTGLTKNKADTGHTYKLIRE